MELIKLPLNKGQKLPALRHGGGGGADLIALVISRKAKATGSDFTDT